MRDLRMLSSKVSPWTHLWVCVTHSKAKREAQKHAGCHENLSYSIWNRCDTERERRGGRKTLSSRACNSTFSYFNKNEAKIPLIWVQRSSLFVAKVWLAVIISRYVGSFRGVSAYTPAWLNRKTILGCQSFGQSVHPVAQLFDQNKLIRNINAWACITVGLEVWPLNNSRNSVVFYKC